MITTTTRPLTAVERATLDRFLREDFPGAPALRRQSQHVVVAGEQWAADDPTVNLAVDRNLAAPADVGHHRVPVEGRCTLEGQTIEVLLHVVDGYLDELEYVVYTTEPLKAIPLPDILEVSTASFDWS